MRKFIRQWLAPAAIQPVNLNVEVTIRDCTAGGRPVVFAVFDFGPDSPVVGPVTKTPQYSRPLLPVEGTVQTKDIFDDYQSNVRLDPTKLVDKRGNKLTLDGSLAFSTDNTDVMALNPGSDGLSCGVKAVGPIGQAVVQAKGTVKEGNTPILLSVQFNVIPDPNTVQADLIVDDPTPQDAPPAPVTPPVTPPGG